MLCFIERDRHIQAGNKSVGIALGRGQNAWIVEGEVLAILLRQFRRLHQSALPGLTGTVYQDSRRVCESIQEPVDKVATKHGSIIDQMMGDNQPLCGRLSEWRTSDRPTADVDVLQIAPSSAAFVFDKVAMQGGACIENTESNRAQFGITLNPLSQQREMLTQCGSRLGAGIEVIEWTDEGSAHIPVEFRRR